MPPTSRSRTRARRHRRASSRLRPRAQRGSGASPAGADRSRSRIQPVALELTYAGRREHADTHLGDHPDLGPDEWLAAVPPGAVAALDADAPSVHPARRDLAVAHM